MDEVDPKTDFARSAEISPDLVYRHQVRGWRYVARHPFFNELPQHDPDFEKFAHSGLVEAYCEMDDKIVLITVCLDSIASRQAGLYIRTRSDGGNEALVVLENEYFVSREEFEAGMECIYSTNQIGVSFSEDFSQVEVVANDEHSKGS